MNGYRVYTRNGSDTYFSVDARGHLTCTHGGWSGVPIEVNGRPSVDVGRSVVDYDSYKELTAEQYEAATQ